MRYLHTMVRVGDLDTSEGPLRDVEIGDEHGSSHR